MKKFLLGTLLLVSTNVYAQTSATVIAASNYIWRGLSFSTNGAAEVAKGLPVIQGSFDYAHSSGLGLSLFVGSSDTTNDFTALTVERDSEFSPTVSYTYAMTEDFKVIGAVTQYTYVKNSNNNAIDYQLSFAWKTIRLDGAYMNKYLGTESSDTYVRLSMRQPLDEKLGLVLAVGNSSFSKEAKVGFKNYTDYKAGLFFNAGPAVIEAAYTDTNRKDMADKDLKDEAATFSVATTFQ